jgi:phosphatidylserine/phosphatidylglycerophosphate/cardiolipin synthase-like enzyme
VVLCTGCARRLPPQAPPSPSGTLQEAFDALPGAVGPSRVALLTDGREAWAARWELLKSAERRVDTAYYIVENDVLGYAFIALLHERARVGVKVRLLVDSVGGLAMLVRPGRDYLQELVATGNVEIHVFNPPLSRLGAALADANFTEAIARTHQKMLIVDRRVAIAGGRNIARKYFVPISEHPRAFADADVLLDGRAALKDLERSFDDEFGAWHKRELDEDPVNIVPRATELAMIYRAMEAWLRMPADDDRSDDELALALEAAALEPLDVLPTQSLRERVRGHLRQLVRHRSLRGALPWELSLPYDSTLLVVAAASRAQRKDPTINRSVMQLMSGAQHTVHFESPFFLLTTDLVPAFEQLSARGVDVTVLTNSPASSDNPISQALFIDGWPEVLARAKNLRLFVVTERPMLHAKRAVFDDEVTLVGSYNLDPLSARVNSELIAAVRSGAFARLNADQLNARRRAADVLEYRIARGADGTALRHPRGHPRAGRVVVEFGPRDHCPPEQIRDLERLRGQVLSLAGFFDFELAHY